MKNIKILYIIGNGFDLHHKLASSYWDFMQFIKQEDESLYNLVEEYLQIEDNWSDFEDAFASIDVYSLTEYASIFLKSYGADDWRDSAHHDYQYEIEQVVTHLSIMLKQYFIAWLKQLNVSRKKLLELQKSAQYLTFNYTKTLQCTYQIANKNILHIHGSIKHPQNIILGHAWKPKSNQYVGELFEVSDTEVRILEGNEILEEYFLQTFKPSRKIIKKNQIFFRSLHAVRTVYVLGHSISDIDVEYFCAIVKSTNLRKVQWIVSYHDKNDKINYKKKFQNIGIPRSNIKLIKLSKLKRKKSYE